MTDIFLELKRQTARAIVAGCLSDTEMVKIDAAVERQVSVGVMSHPLVHRALLVAWTLQSQHPYGTDKVEPCQSGNLVFCSLDDIPRQ